MIAFQVKGVYLNQLRTAIFGESPSGKDSG